jgi:hypothetical protein
MAAWTDLATLIASLAAGRAVTDEKMQALAENVAAGFEAAQDALVVQQGWHPDDMIAYGDGNDGMIYNSAVDGSVASIISNDFEDGYEYAFLASNLTVPSGGDILVEFYRETGAAYSATGVIGTSGGAGNVRMYAWLEMIRPRDVMNGHVFSSRGAIGPTPSNTTFPGGGVLFGGIVTHTTAQKVLRVRFTLSTGNFAAGTLQQFRRVAP